MLATSPKSIANAAMSAHEPVSSAMHVEARAQAMVDVEARKLEARLEARMDEKLGGLHAQLRAIQEQLLQLPTKDQLAEAVLLASHEARL